MFFAIVFLEELSFPVVKNLRIALLSFEIMIMTVTFWPLVCTMSRSYVEEYRQRRCSMYTQITIYYLMFLINLLYIIPTRFDTLEANYYWDN